jgi:lipid A 3-O-deacylase
MSGARWVVGRRCALAIAMAVGIATAGAARATVHVTGVGPELVAGSGAIGVESGDNSAATFDLELRLKPRRWGLRPTFGALATLDDSSYVRIGASRDIFLGDWIANVGFGVGTYTQGEGKYLGQSLQFRSALDVSYRVRERLRIGVAVAHLSNAGLSRINPGIETVTFTFTWEPSRR